MGDPLPGEGAPPREAAGAQTTATAETPRRRRLRLRLPTPVLVTLLGIGLSAWLLPAFTKQWEDRRRAGELKAELASDIATATAGALIGLEHRLRDADDARVTREADQWASRSLQIEARLRAYFPSDVVTAWHLYAYLTGRVVAPDRYQPVVALGQASRTLQVNPGLSLAADVVEADATLLAILEELQRGRSQSSRANDLLATLHERSGPAARSLVDQIFRGSRQELVSWEEAQTFLLLAQEVFTVALLEAHPAGYSTSAGDLLDDLLP